MPYARVTFTKSDPSKLEASIANFKEKVVPVVRSAPQYMVSGVLANRETGEAEAFTAWETLKAMNATEQMAQEARRQAQEATSAHVVDIDRFEYFLRDVRGELVFPMFARWYHLYAELAKIDQTIEFVRTKVKDSVSAEPGYRALIGVVNRMTGRISVDSNWTNAEARAASSQAVAAQLQEAARIAGDTSMRVEDNEYVFADIKQAVVVG